MPTTGRHSYGRQASSRSEQSDNQLYPNLTGMDIEMSNLEEDRVSLVLQLTVFQANVFFYLIFEGLIAKMETYF